MKLPIDRGGFETDKPEDMVSGRGQERLVSRDEVRQGSNVGWVVSSSVLFRVVSSRSRVQCVQKLPTSALISESSPSGSRRNIGAAVAQDGVLTCWGGGVVRRT